MKKYTPVIGMEIHVELKTKSKMFCRCSADWFGRKPNTHTCPVCLGLPGALPVPNKTAIEWCIKLGLALNCKIPQLSKFDRKNYFYPDLPKGYQISQYDQPFAVGGYLKKIGIRRVHLEEDTGKLIHEGDATLIDFNRSGVPLVEIVTEPDIRGSEEAKEFLQELHRIIKYLDISDADMEKGSMRLEPNISVGTGELPNYKVEVKNINSFNFVRRAIDFEIKRHIEILEKGENPIQETRGWDEDRGLTYSQRTKEEAHDYRYFPEPDIPPMILREEDIERLRESLPDLPQDKREKYKKMGIKEADIEILINDNNFVSYFEQALNIVRQLKEDRVGIQEIANWIVNKRIDLQKVKPAELIKQILAKKEKSDISSDLLSSVINDVLTNNKQAVADYKKGKTNVIMFLVGQVLRKTKGKGNPQTIKAHIEKLIL